MQLDIHEIIDAIEKHTDHTLNLEAAARGEGLPHIVWELLSSTPDIAMSETQNCEYVTFRLTVFADSCLEAETIHKSLAGSFDLGTPTLEGYDLIWCKRLNSSLLFVNGTWQARLVYELFIQEA